MRWTRQSRVMPNDSHVSSVCNNLILSTLSVCTGPVISGIVKKYNLSAFSIGQELTYGLENKGKKWPLLTNRK